MSRVGATLVVGLLGLSAIACSSPTESTSSKLRSDAMPYVKAFVYQESVEHNGKQFTAAVIADPTRNGLSALPTADTNLAEVVRKVLQDDYRAHRAEYLARIHVAQGEAFEGGGAFSEGRFNRDAAQDLLWKRIIDDPQWQQRVFPAITAAGESAGISIGLPKPLVGTRRSASITEVTRVHDSMAQFMAEDAVGCAGNPLVAFQRTGGADPDMASVVYELVVQKPLVTVEECVQALQAKGWEVVR